MEQTWTVELKKFRMEETLQTEDHLLKIKSISDTFKKLTPDIVPFVHNHARTQVNNRIFRKLLKQNFTSYEANLMVHHWTTLIFPNKVKSPREQKLAEIVI